MWYNSNWQYRVKVTIDHTKVAATLSDFVVLVDVTLDASHVSNANGYDALFTKSDDATLLSFDIESYDSGTGRLVAWVKVPSLSSIADTEIHLYYGNSSISTNPSSASTWSAYAGVWFLSEATTGTSVYKDRTSNANHMSSVGTHLTAGVSGKITKALANDGYTGSVNRAITNSAMNNPSGDLLVMAWVKTSADAQNGNAQFVWEESGGRFRFYTTGSTAWIWRLYKTSGTLTSLSGTTLDQTWQHVAARISASDSGAFSYLDGAQVNTNATVNSYIGTNDKVAVLSSGTASQGANGAISHLMIANADYGASWVATAHTNQDAASSFYTVASEETGTTGTTVSPSALSASFSLPSITVTAIRNVTVSPSALTGTFSIPAPTVSTGGSSGWYNASWGYRVKVTVDHTKIGSTLSNFPVFVDLSALDSNFFAHVDSAGADIRVTRSDGTTECEVEVVELDTVAGTGELHFLADSLSASVDTDFYIYYGNASASAYAVTDTYGRNNVWLNANYAFVAHLHSGTVPDSTGINGDSTENGGTSTTGLVGSAAAYDGSHNTHWTTAAGLTSNILSAVTFTAVMNATSSWSRSFEIQNQIFLLLFTGAGDQGVLIKQSGTNHVADGGTLSTGGVWHHIGGVFDGAAGTLKAYTAGVLNATTSSLPSTIDGTSGGNDLNIGSDVSSGSSGSAYHTGAIDELRVATEAKSADWILSEKESLISNSTFLTAGSEETNAGSLSTDLISFSFSTATNVTVSATALSGTFSIPATSESGDAAVSVSTLTGTFSLPAPTVTATQNVTVSAGTLAGTFSLPSATVTATQSVTVSASTLNGTFSMPTQTVSTTQSITISAGTLPATFSLPSATFEGDVTDSATALTGSFSIPAPSITTDTSISASALTGTFSIPAATVVTPDEFVSVGTLTGSFSMPTATVTAIQNVTISASALTATSSIPAAAVTVDVSTVPTALSATFSIPAPTISAIRNVSISASALTGTFSIPAASAGGDTIISAGTLSATFSIASPSVTAGASVSAGTLDGAFSMPAVTVTATRDASISASALTGTFSLPSETVTATRDALVSVSELTGVFSMPSVAVIVTLNATISAETLVGTFSMPSDVAAIGVVVAVNALTGTFSLPSPTVTATADIDLVPAVLSGTFSIPTPTVSTTRFVTVTPDPLTATFAIAAQYVSGDFWQPLYDVVEIIESDFWSALDSVLSFSWTDRISMPSFTWGAHDTGGDTGMWSAKDTGGDTGMWDNKY